jgi:hypothetical protein
MKKLICIGLLCAAPSVFATGARVSTLGGETAMLPDDDTNIDLFPQSINKFNMFSISNVDNYSNAGYAIITGDPGNKWGFYGYQGTVDSFINVYRSFSANSAAKIGFLYSTPKTEYSGSNNEPAPNDATVSESQDEKSLGIDVLYGMTDPATNTEYAFQFVYSKGPSSINYTGGQYTGGSVSNFSYSDPQDVDVADGIIAESGSAEAKALVLGFQMRKATGFWIFNNMYAEASYSKFSDNSSYTETDTVNVVTTQEDDTYDITTLHARGLLFNSQALGSSGGTRLVYGLGASLDRLSGSLSQYAGTLAGGSAYYDDADGSALVIGGPQIRIGLEKDIKYGVLRFGIQRNINFYSNGSTDWTYGGSTGTAGDTVNDTESFDSSGIGTNGNMTVRTGWGLEYDNLKIDIMLTDTFWRSGPQMIFDSSLGSIGTRADVVYSF